MSECDTARYCGSEVFLVGWVLELDLEVFYTYSSVVVTASAKIWPFPIIDCSYWFL